MQQYLFSIIVFLKKTQNAVEKKQTVDILTKTKILL